MKMYEIFDTDNAMHIGVLLYYEKEKAFVIELSEELDEWTAPMLFMALVKQKNYTVPKELGSVWVRERIIPSGRQNIGSILSNHRLPAYDEMRLLELSKGICSQDSLSIRKIDDLPDYVKERMKKNIAECFLTHDDRILCFFLDDTVRKVDLTELQIPETEKILRNRMLFESCRVGTGGYSIEFGGVMDISAANFYSAGQSIPLSAKDFRLFVTRNLLDSTESCEELSCTKQNLAYLKEKCLEPVRENVKGSLFQKGDLLRLKW